MNILGKRNKVVDNDVEMYGGRFKNQAIESDNESNSYSEENNSEMSEQSDGEESDSELSEQWDSEEDIKYMKGFGDIKFVGDKTHERADSKIDLDHEDIEIDGYVYK